MVIFKDKIYVLEVNGSPGTGADYEGYHYEDYADTPNTTGPIKGKQLVDNVIDYVSDRENWDRQSIIEIGYVETLELKSVGLVRAKLDTGGVEFKDEVGLVGITTPVKAKAGTSGFEANRTLVVEASQLPTVDATETQAIAGSIPFSGVALDVADDGNVERNNFLVKLSTTFRSWLESLVTSIDGIISSVSALDVRVTTNENNITNIDSRVTINEGDITALDGRVTVNEGAITTVEGDISTIQGDITNIENNGINYTWSTLASSVINVAYISGQVGTYTTSVASSSIKYIVILSPLEFCHC